MKKVCSKYVFKGKVLGGDFEAKLAYFSPFKRTSDHAKTKKEVRYGKRV